MCVLT